ncbi:MAG: exodeoxyribonuclease III [Bacteroidota bacterium]|nr:exodeoxyribonuclease III [Bacteroidota bacterium]MDX5431155.1 exodeoxyribonuclease III [Bacteroidota bacterium]
MKKIITYNVNGIRAALNKGFAQWLKEENPDVVCIQEIKAFKAQVETGVFEHLGYHHFWYSAEKPGYSGVAILSKEEPKHVEYGTGNELYDREGRVIRADYEGYSVMSIYHPSGSSGDARQEFKMGWLDFFLSYVNDLRKSIPNLVLCGDYNICHKAIDIHDPVSNKDSSGFLPEERAWFDQFVDQGYIDSFRTLHPEPHQYTWWSYRANARANNKGWRIDYIMLTESLKDKLLGSKILPDAKHSDHCPMYTELSL